MENVMDTFLRRFATPLSLVTGVAISITGIMMFFGIRGALNDIHEWIGWAFVAALLMHIVRNWRGVLGMLRPWTSKAVVGVLGMTLAVLVATHLPSGEGGGHRGGPWLIVNRVGTVPITAAAPALGMTSEQAIAKLKAKGITVEGPQQSLADIARKEDTALPRLFALLLND
jgi:hypothetical protein